MLSSILNSSRAIQMNILIMRIFTNARKLLMDTTELRLEIEKIKLAVFLLRALVSIVLKPGTSRSEPLSAGIRFQSRLCDTKA